MLNLPVIILALCALQGAALLYVIRQAAKFNRQTRYPAARPVKRSAILEAKLDYHVTENL
jgi:hypothetical protein